MKYFYNFSNKQQIYKIHLLVGFSLSAFLTYKTCTYNKKIETDIYEQYRTFRDN